MPRRHPKRRSGLLSARGRRAAVYLAVDRLLHRGEIVRLAQCAADHEAHRHGVAARAVGRLYVVALPQRESVAAVERYASRRKLAVGAFHFEHDGRVQSAPQHSEHLSTCLLYTSDAADD